MFLHFLEVVPRRPYMVEDCMNAMQLRPGSPRLCFAPGPVFQFVCFAGKIPFERGEGLGDCGRRKVRTMCGLCATYVVGGRVGVGKTRVCSTYT